MAKLRNDVTGIATEPINQTKAIEVKEKIFNVIAERVPELEMADVKGGKAIQIAEDQFAVVRIEVKKNWDFDDEVKEEAERKQAKAAKAAEAAAKAKAKAEKK